MDTIITQRLTLRKITRQDAPQLIDQINNLNVSRYMSAVPYPYEQKDADWWIQHCNQVESKDRIHFVIIRTEDQKLIGGIDLMNLQFELKSAQLGYWLGEEFWRQGYGFEAGQAIIRYAFEALPIEVLTLHICIENLASHALVKKLGFRHQQRAKDRLKAVSTGEYHDYDILELRAENFNKNVV